MAHAVERAFSFELASAAVHRIRVKKNQVFKKTQPGGFFGFYWVLRFLRVFRKFQCVV